MIGVANVIQTVPSLALFGLLLPVPWLGENAARLAILALTGYALLPILRNTYAGIAEVDPALIDVSNAMGMNGMQRLLKVELPLAASVILAGLRTATVTCVGVATIAAAIGAGGLGELIFRGVASVWITRWCWRGRFRRRCWLWWQMRGWVGWRGGWRCGGEWDPPLPPKCVKVFEADTLGLDFDALFESQPNGAGLAWGAWGRRVCQARRVWRRRVGGLCLLVEIFWYF